MQNGLRKKTELELSDPFQVLALDSAPPALFSLQQPLQVLSMPVAFSVDGLQPAAQADMESREWDAAFVLWNAPELESLALVVRYTPGLEEEADSILEILGGKLGAEEASDMLQQHISQTQAVYSLQPQAALLSDPDHDGWEMLEILLSTLAGQTNGIIYAEAAGFFDADMSLLLPDTNREEDEEE